MLSQQLDYCNTEFAYNMYNSNLDKIIELINKEEKTQKEITLMKENQTKMLAIIQKLTNVEVKHSNEIRSFAIKFKDQKNELNVLNKIIAYFDGSHATLATQIKDLNSGLKESNDDREFIYEDLTTIKDEIDLIKENRSKQYVTGETIEIALNLWKKQNGGDIYGLTFI